LSPLGGGEEEFGIVEDEDLVRELDIDDPQTLEVGVTRALIESDFIDDPKRPGAVMYPWDIRKEVEKALSRGGFEEVLKKYLVDNVVSLYEVSPP